MTKFARNILITSMAAVLATASPCLAQMGGGGPKMDPALVHYFGDHKAFSSKIEMQMKSGSQGGNTMVMNMAVLEGKMRTEIDMGQMQGMPAEGIAQMKKMGMDKITTISRPDKKVSWMVYPGLNAYVEMPITEGQKADAAATKGKVDVTSMGKETIDGHPCDKNKLVYTDEDGKKHEALVWNATDLKNFPVQMEMGESGNVVVMKYKDVSFEKPDSKNFEIADDLKKYDNMQALMQGEMMKRMGMGGMGMPQ